MTTARPAAVPSSVIKHGATPGAGPVLVSPADPAAPGARRTALIVGVLAIAVFMSSLDLFIVNLAFPYIGREYQGTTLSALSWVLNSSFVTGVIAGPRTEQHWDDYLRALDYRFTAEDEALIDRLVASGHPSTPGYNDPAYPIEGRRARTSG